MEDLTLLSALWTAGGILVAFQTAALTLRVNREIDVGEARRVTWLPLADWINILSIGATLLGVFVAQALSLASPTTARVALAYAALLLAAYPLALAGHYDMLRPSTARTWTYCTTQEACAVTLTVAAATALVVRAEVPVGFAAWLLPPLLVILITAWWHVILSRRQRSAVRRDIEAQLKASARLLDQLKEVEDGAAHALKRNIRALEQRYEELLAALVTADDSQASLLKALRAEKARVAQLLSEWRRDLVELHRVYAEARAAATVEGHEGANSDSNRNPEWNPRVAAAQVREFMDRAGDVNRRR